MREVCPDMNGGPPDQGNWEKSPEERCHFDWIFKKWTLLPWLSKEETGIINKGKRELECLRKDV